MLTKKERIKLDRERESLNKNLHGIRRLNRVPDALFVIDVGKEEIAVREANRLGIPVIGVVDTNWSPDGVDFVIPGNDDALRAVRLFSSRIADAILAGQQFARGGELPVAATSRSMAATQAIDHRGTDEAHLELVADEASVGVASEPTDLLIEMPYARN
jgi:small subunit ribosomal protein S2